MTPLPHSYFAARARRMTKGTSLALLFGTLVVTACGDLNVTDLNNPGLSELEKNPTRITVIDATET